MTPAAAATATRDPGMAPPGEIELHAWAVPLDVPASALAGLGSTLSQDELERAARFRFRRDADRFVAGRGQLRSILAGLTERDPAELRFAYGSAGKPSLADDRGLSFNFSNSAGQGLLAVAQGAEVGVDVESEPAPPGAAEEIAPLYFAAQEIADLDQLPESARGAAFLRCWTRKEAYVKALGDGLQAPLEDFAVTLSGEAALRWCRRPEERERWDLLDLSHLTPGATAAACVEGRVSTLVSHPRPPC